MLFPVLLAVASTACATPLMRPMRAHPGLHATVAGGSLIGASDEQMCYEGCDEQQVRTILMPNVNLRYGTMLKRNIGLTIGGNLLAGSHLVKKKGAAGLLLPFIQVSKQSRLASLAAGLDIGGNVIAPTVGFDVQPWGGGGWRPNLAAYARLALPFSKEPAPEPDQPTLATTSWDTGVTLRLGRWLVQYSYSGQRDGRSEFPLGIEGSIQARSWHSVFIGASFPIAWVPAKKRPLPPFLQEPASSPSPHTGPPGGTHLIR